MNEKIRAAIEKRTQTDDEWEEAVDKCWQEETAILTEDINKPVLFSIKCYWLYTVQRRSLP